MSQKKKTTNLKKLLFEIISQEAEARHIRCRYLDSNERLLELCYKGHFEYMIGKRSLGLSCVSDRIAEDKAITKYFLAKNEVSFTPGKIFLRDDVKGIKAFINEIGFPVVVKKHNGTEGNLVFVGVGSMKECLDLIGRYFQKEKYVLVEKEFKGKEYRFFATKDKVLGVIAREPASVVGDGVHSIGELIRVKNNSRLDRLRRLFKIKVDMMVEMNLKSQKLDLDSIISRDKKIYLRRNSNVSTGGDGIDVTDRVHPALKKIAIKAVNSIPGLPWGGVDIMVDGDISRRPEEKNYTVLEINSNPGILPHYFPSEGSPRNIISGIFDVLFPETKK